MVQALNPRLKVPLLLSILLFFTLLLSACVVQVPNTGRSEKDQVELVSPIGYCEATDQLVVHVRDRVEKTHYTVSGDDEMVISSNDHRIYLVNANDGEKVMDISVGNAVEGYFINRDTLYLIKAIAVPLEEGQTELSKNYNRICLEAYSLEGKELLYSADQFYRDHRDLSDLFAPGRPRLSLFGSYFFEGSDGLCYELNLSEFSCKPIRRAGYLALYNLLLIKEDRTWPESEILEIFSRIRTYEHEDVLAHYVQLMEDPTEDLNIVEEVELDILREDEPDIELSLPKLATAIVRDLRFSKPSAFDAPDLEDFPDAFFIVDMTENKYLYEWVKEGDSSGGKTADSILHYFVADPQNGKVTLDLKLTGNDHYHRRTFKTEDALYLTVNQSLIALPFDRQWPAYAINLSTGDHDKLIPDGNQLILGD